MLLSSQVEKHYAFEPGAFLFCHLQGNAQGSPGRHEDEPLSCTGTSPFILTEKWRVTKTKKRSFFPWGWADPLKRKNLQCQTEKGQRFHLIKEMFKSWLHAKLTLGYVNFKTLIYLLMDSLQMRFLKKKEEKKKTILNCDCRSFLPAV